jgi:RNA polymerase sigma factor, sigma-70 family
LEDQELVGLLLDGEKNAFSLFVKRTEGLVAQIVFKMIPITEDRKDLVQDIYLNAYRNLKNFRFQSKLSTWIGSIAYHACYNYLKKKRLLLLETSQEDDTHTSLLETMSNRLLDHSSNDTIAQIFRKDLATALQMGIDQLSPVYATLIALYHYQELSYQEITEITGLPEGTLKSYLFRARKQLREHVLINYKKEDL